MKKTVSAYLLALVSYAHSALTLSSQMPSVDIAYDKFTLDNGLTVVVHEDRKAPIVAISIWYHVGSKNEPAGKTGFAHLFEHLMFNGSENYDGEYFEPFENVGATGMNGTTWFDRTNYFETFSATDENLNWALDLEADRMVNSFIRKEDLDSEMTVVRNELENGENSPVRVLISRMLAASYDWHNYGKSTIGAISDLENVKNESLRYLNLFNALLIAG